nr:RNA polymerase-binding protein DksA [Lacisediminimonas profundi]
MNATVTRAAKKPAAKKAAATTKAPPAGSDTAAARKASAKVGAGSGEPTLATPSESEKTVRRPVAANPEVLVSSNKASASSADRIQKPEVSRVSEVATKTSKSTPAPANGQLLTEEQLLQMGEKDYMNAAQLAFFKARLQQLERDLLKNAGETTEHLRETVLVPDPADRATIEEEHALELRTRDRERKLLKKVQQSIASIDSGDYGWCEETGEPIGIPRLLARPTATLSLEAQQRRELKQKLYGD